MTKHICKVHNVEENDANDNTLVWYGNGMFRTVEEIPIVLDETLDNDMLGDNILNDPPIEDNTPSNGLNCKQCDTTFSRKGNLNKHIKKFHPEIIICHACTDACTETFLSKRNMLIHLDNFHTQNNVKCLMSNLCLQGLKKMYKLH